MLVIIISNIVMREEEKTHFTFVAFKMRERKVTKLPEQPLSGQQTEYYQGDSIKADGIMLCFCKSVHMRDNF